MQLLQALSDKGVVDAARRAAAEAELQKPGVTEEGALTKAGVAGSDILAVKGEYYGIPTRELGTTPVPFDVLRYVPEESARHYQIAPIGVQDAVLEVGITDPDNLEARDALTFISAKVGMPYKLFLITEADFEKLLTQYKGLSGEVGKALGELETELTIEATKDGAEKNEKRSLALEDDLISETEAQAITEDAPVTKIVATVLRHAAASRRPHSGAFSH